jgi:hypothetical protein
MKLSDTVPEIGSGPSVFATCVSHWYVRDGAQVPLDGARHFWSEVSQSFVALMLQPAMRWHDEWPRTVRNLSQEPAHCSQQPAHCRRGGISIGGKYAQTVI